jgi:CRP/FNR family transcriptional regulator, cyclic AMP receptor protein
LTHQFAANSHGEIHCVKAIDADARRAALARTQIFQALQPSDLDLILGGAAVRRVTRGTAVLRRGDPGGGMVVIMSGRVRVSVISEDGKEVTLCVLGQGEVLGEMSLLDGEPCSADVTAQEDCVLLVIERGQFLALLRANNALCLHLMSLLTRRLRRANAALEDMALLDLPARLGRLLARLADDYGVPVRSGTRIEVKLSQKDLSTLVGASREKVNRQIRQWEDDGVLAKDSGRMVVVDSQALAPLH